MTTDRPGDVFYIGIDGGGSGCRARLVDQAGRVCALAALDRPANMATDAVAAWGAVMTLCDDALHQAGLPRDVLDQTIAGIALAGLGQSRVRRQAETLAHPFLARTLATDAEAACLGAHGGADGAIVIAGTGSIALAITEGRIVRIGGWGFPVSDHGSGAWLGLEAVREALLAHDGLAPHGTMAKSVLARFDGDPESIVYFRSHAQPADFAALAAFVIDTAETDPRAQALLFEAGSILGAMAEKLPVSEPDRLSILGGLASVLTPFLPTAVRARLTPPAGDGVDGALILARSFSQG